MGRVDFDYTVHDPLSKEVNTLRVCEECLCYIRDSCCLTQNENEDDIFNKVTCQITPAHPQASTLGR